MRLHETTAAPSPPMTDAPLRLDQEAARQHAERPFEDAHALVGDEAMNAGIAHQAFGKGQEHGIVGADEFEHSWGLPFVNFRRFQGNVANRLLPHSPALSIVPRRI